LGIVRLTNNGNDAWLHLDKPVWLPDGQGLIAPSMGTHAQLWMFHYPRGPALRITHDLFRYIGASITADSKKLVSG